MRIDDTGAPSTDSGVKSSDRDSSRTRDNESSFSKVLAKKRESGQEGAKGGKPGEGDVAGMIPGLMGAQGLLDPSLQPAPVEGQSTVVAVPPELQQLVREISSVVNAEGNQQMNIELNSNVLKGLQIRIERQRDGAIAVQFQSSSADVARLLAKNVDVLSQGLAERGVNVANIRINRGESSAMSTFKPRSAYSGGQQGGRQGGRR